MAETDIGAGGPARSAVWTLEAFMQLAAERHSDLKEHIKERFTDNQIVLDKRFTETDLRYQQRFDAQQKALADALAAQEKATATALSAAKEAVNAALTAADRAVTKAEIASEKRFESVNEFRAVLTAQSALMATKDELSSGIRGLADKLEQYNESLSSRINQVEHVLTDKIDGTTGIARQFAEFRAGYTTKKEDIIQGSDRGFHLSQQWIGIVGIIVGALIAIAAIIYKPQSQPVYPQSSNTQSVPNR